MFRRLLQLPLSVPKSFFLFGPRGVGKTTWLNSQVPDAVTINLLEAETYFRLSSHLEEIRRIIKNQQDNWIIIDEVQRVPQLLNEVHDLIESQRFRFILTYSSARPLRRSGVNLLAGRALTYRMHPLTAIEQGEAFDLDQSVQFGHLPARFDEANPAQYLRDYVQTYLREEVIQEGLTRNVGNLSRFLETASFSQGSVVNKAEIAREAFLDRGTTDNYFSILEDLLISYQLPVFSRKVKRKLIRQQKFYYFDAGVFRSIRPAGPLDSESELDGPTLETLVFQEIQAINDYMGYRYTIHYWRTTAGLEVDFVLYGPQGMLAIEVKRSRTITSKDVRSLREFQKDYPPAQCMVFYGGSQRQELDDIQIWPIGEALTHLDTILQPSGTD